MEVCRLMKTEGEGASLVFQSSLPVCLWIIIIECQTNHAKSGLMFVDHVIIN